MKSHPKLITMFMTAYAADELIKNGTTLGIKAVLTKPLDMDLLLLMFESIQKTLYPFSRAVAAYNEG
jgi:hypothetical protein